MKSAARHPLNISGLVRCKACNGLVQHYGIGTLSALLLSILHHRRTCSALNDEREVA